MRNWVLLYKRGLRLLAKHDPRGAAQEFRLAVEGCPAFSRRDLARVLYYFGLALERSGHGDLAVKSWINARKLVRGGAIARAYGRWVNEYGMRRRMTHEADDYFAFKSIQVGRYLSKRGSGRFASRAERDAVTDLIADAWRLLRDSGILKGLSTERKLALYRRARVNLPFLYVEDALDVGREPLVGNFRSGDLRSFCISPNDSCPCGSGLPYRACCGRLQSCTELEYGSL